MINYLLPYLFPYKYKENDDGIGITLINYCGDDLLYIKVPSSIGGKFVTHIGEGCFANSKHIEVIDIPSTVIDIGTNVFSNNMFLRSVTLPNSVENIGAYAFSDCMYLNSIKLPPMIKRLEIGLFSHCHLLTDVRLPANLKSIGSHSFYGTAVKYLKLPDSVSEIETGAFAASFIELDTVLPLEKRWFMEWPYGERVTHSNYGDGMITGCRGDENDSWYEISVQFSNESKMFFVTDELISSLIFKNNDLTKWLHMRIENKAKNNGENYNLWRRGLI